MKAESSVAVLIINWNGADDTIELLKSLRGAADASLSLVASVIDNASDDADFRRLATFLESAELGFSVALIRNRNNVGVPLGYNQAIQSAGLDSEAYLRLDNDVVLPAGAIDVLLDTLRARRKDAVGIVGGNVRYYSTPDVDNGGAVAINLVAGKTVTTYPSEVTVCDGVLGCVMLIDGDLVRALAPTVFCGELFICTDESELSLRARRLGVNTLYVPTTIGYHKGGASTSRVSRMANYYSARNWAFLRLLYSPGWMRKCLILASIGAYSGLRLIQLRPLFLVASFAGFCMYLSHWIDSRVLGRGLSRPLDGDRR